MKDIPEPLRTDVLMMIQGLQADQRFGPYVLYIPDELLRSLGFDPENYPELEDCPGIRFINVSPSERPS